MLRVLTERCVSWHFSQALVEDFSQATCSDGERFAPLRSTTTREAYLWRDRTTEALDLFQFGMTLQPSTQDLGAELLTWCREGSRASRFQARLEVATPQKTCGLKCSESSKTLSLDLSLQKTSRKSQLTLQPMTLSRWVIKSDAWISRRQTWVQTTFGNDIGYLHTPTSTANYSAPYMMRWKACQEFVRVFGQPHPTNAEWMMGWPIGWTDLSPLATDRFRRWQQEHGSYFQER